MKPRPRRSSAYISIMKVTAAAPNAVSTARSLAALAVRGRRGGRRLTALAGAALQLVAPALVRSDLSSYVVLGDLGPPRRAAAPVLRLDHLVHVVHLKLGLDLGRAREPPVHLVGARPRIPLPDRQEDPDYDQPAEENERRELVHAVRVYAPGPCPTPSSSTPSGRPSDATPAFSRPSAPTTSPPARSERLSSATDSIPRVSTRSTWAARTRPARTTATWRGWRR